MADVNANTSPFARAAFVALWLLVVFGAPAMPAEQQPDDGGSVEDERGVASPYYLTLTLVESHLPDKLKKDKVFGKVFVDVDSVATLQIEFDVDGSTAYKSTTIARTFIRQEKNWIGSTFGGAKDMYGNHDLKNYVIVKKRKMYDSNVILGAVYSATFNSTVVMENFLNDAKGAGLAFQVAEFTYSGLAAQALRIFTRSSQKKFSVTSRIPAEDMRQKNCIILRPTEIATEGHLRCENAKEKDRESAYVELKVEVHSSLFTGEDDRILQAIYNYMDLHHMEQVTRLVDWQEMDMEQLDKECRDFIRALDAELVRNDRNLVLLGLLKKMNYDPEAKRDIACWADNKNSLVSLTYDFESLALGGCSKNRIESRKECEVWGAFTKGWRKAGEYKEKFSWSVEIETGERFQEAASTLERLLKRYELEELYGGFERNKGTWTGAGVVRDASRGGCRFPAEIEISVVGNAVHNLKVIYKEHAGVKGSSVMGYIEHNKRKKCNEEV